VKVGLDTSVVLRLLVGEPANQAERAWRAVVEVRSGGGEVFVSDLVASEAYFALHHHYAVPKGEALRQLRALFASGELVSEGVAPEVLATPKLASAKPGFVDRMIHAGYLRSLDQTLTFERAAGKLARARVLTTS
jgi:predicted nucleic-acid-binding protein